MLHSAVTEHQHRNHPGTELDTSCLVASPHSVMPEGAMQDAEEELSSTGLFGYRPCV